MKNRIAILILITTSLLPGQLKGMWLRYTFDPIFEFKNGKKIPMFSDEEYQYFHLKIIGLDTSRNFRLWSYPVMIKGRDTLFSASDGGFYFGKGVYVKKRGQIFVSGKYTGLEYVATLGDSGFKDTLRGVNSKVVTDTRGNFYNRIDSIRIMERWKIDLN